MIIIIIITADVILTVQHLVNHLKEVDTQHTTTQYYDVHTSVHVQALLCVYNMSQI